MILCRRTFIKPVVNKYSWIIRLIQKENTSWYLPQQAIHNWTKASHFQYLIWSCRSWKGGVRSRRWFTFRRSSAPAPELLKSHRQNWIRIMCRCWLRWVIRIWRNPGVWFSIRIWIILEARSKIMGSLRSLFWRGICLELGWQTMIWIWKRVRTSRLRVSSKCRLSRLMRMTMDRFRVVPIRNWKRIWRNWSVKVRLIGK